ncbi:MAG: phospholipid carrier-dependent glycosyltransferase [Methylococcaceae bacterium]|nr:MAG: phospholipid carrier-dependent glycosyltransferase [Methylococcaceae bacterium]
MSDACRRSPCFRSGRRASQDAFPRRAWERCACFVVHRYPPYNGCPPVALNSTVPHPFDPFYRYACLLTVLAASAIAFWGLGSIPLLSLNEARRALPVQAMLAGGDWLLPRLNGELYITKPPLFYWLGAMVAELRGAVDEWAVRLPSALAALAVLWTGYRVAMRWFGRWSALFAVQILLANAGFAVFARRAEIEMLLTALCSLSLLAALAYVLDQRSRRWLWLSYGLLGLALLTKGPVALLFVTLPLLGYALYSRDPRAWQALRCAEGWLLLLLVGLSWYAAVAARLGLDAWLGVIQGDMLGKMQGSEGSREPFYYYLLWVLGDFFPAILLLLIRPKTLPQSWLQQPACVALLLGVLLPLLAFSLFGDKHAKYLLPAYPALALLLGQQLGALAEQHGLRWLKVLGVLLPLGWAAYFALGEARLYHYRYSALPQIADFLHDHDTIPVYAYRQIDMRTVYYHGRPIAVLPAENAAATLAQTAPALLLAEHDVIAEVAALPGVCVLREFAPYLKRGKKAVVYGNGALCS